LLPDATLVLNFQSTRSDNRGEIPLDALHSCGAHLLRARRQWNTLDDLYRKTRLWDARRYPRWYFRMRQSRPRVTIATGSMSVGCTCRTRWCPFRWAAQQWCGVGRGTGGHVHGRLVAGPQRGWSWARPRARPLPRHGA